MELPRVPDADRIDEESAIEGEAWCPRCDRLTGYSLTKVEFLGNPVKTSFFCVGCGTRMHPEARDRTGALRLQAGARWLRLGAAGSFVLMLLLPVLLIAIALYFLWRLL